MMRTILHSANKNINAYNFCTVPAPNYVDEYRKILIKLNTSILRNEIIQMKKVRKSQTTKLKKMQIIDTLCNLQQRIIQSRVNQLQKKSLFQLQTQMCPAPSTQNQSFDNEKDSAPLSTIEEELPEKTIKTPEYEQQRSNTYILSSSLKKLLSAQHAKVLSSERISNSNIMQAVYHNWWQKQQRRQQELQAQMLQVQSRSDKEGIPQYQTNDKQKEYQLPEKKIAQLKRRPFVNRLFKTGQWLQIEQKKRKYIYEYDKSYIIDQITQPHHSAHKEFAKNMLQITQQRSENQLMKGFFLHYSKRKYKAHFRDKEWILRMFTGFHYYKQLITNPHLIQFIFALTFEKKLPVEYTILKIVEEYMQSPSTFKYSIIVISKEHFLKFLRASANFILKVFKRGGSIDKKEITQDVHAKEDHPTWDQDQQESQQLNHDKDQDEDQEEISAKLISDAQKLPKSRQQIDIQLMQFALAIFQGGIERIITEITTNKQLFLEKVPIQLPTLNKQQQKDLKSTHQTLMLCVQIYKTIQALFSSIQINDFNDLNQLSQVLLVYHKLRQSLAINIHLIEQFMRNYDKQYDEKLQLGLSNIITAKQLDQQNFVLKHQARKLNFDIIDNITSMLKHDNVQITLENRRDKIFGVLQKFFKVYVENGMLDFLEDQLVYTIVRYLQKEVYLHNKVKGLFEARVNFDPILEQTTQQEQGMKSKMDGRPQQETSMDNYTFNPTDQYDFSEPSTKSTSDNSSIQWFQFHSLLPNQQQNSSQSNFSQLITQKVQKSQYYMGKISQLLPKQLLHYLIIIIKYKHNRKQIQIEPIHGFNLIQQWYSEPKVVRIQFLKQQIIQRYKRLIQKEANENVLSQKRKSPKSFHDI